MGPDINYTIHQQPPAEAISRPLMRMDVYTNFQDCGELEAPWDAFVEAVSGDIFQTWDWCRVWWKYYGEHRELRIYVFRTDDEWVGLVPMFLEKTALGPFSIRRAKLIGSDFSFGQFRPAVKAERLRPVFHALLGDLKACGCDQILLGPLAGRYPHTRRLAEALGECCPKGYDLNTAENMVQTYYRLADSHEQWLGRLNASDRNNVRREYRLLEKQALSFRFECSAEQSWEEMFDDFIQLHQEDWNEKGKLGHFRDWPQAVVFHREMAHAQARKGRLRLFRIRCSDGSRAYSYNYRCGDMYFEYLLGRSLNFPRGTSLGRLLHSEIVKYAAVDTVRWIDSMRGKYEYKCHLGGEYFPLQMLALNRTDLPSRLRIGAFDAAARFFHFAYYKLYYCRLAARLPLRWRGGLWKTWVRACGNLRGCLKSSDVSDGGIMKG